MFLVGCFIIIVIIVFIIVSDVWLQHPELKLIENVQAFGKMESDDNASAGPSIDCDVSSTDEESDEGDEPVKMPQVQNAFSLLDTTD